MPNVKMILVGEPHPEFPVEAMIRSMGLSASVRVLGFAPIEDFVGYLGACDIVLNLRFPTVGESSGTLLRSLGLGKAVMVSEVGSFQEFPDDVCLKVPVGAGEEDLIFEYLNLLVSRPEVARAVGRARQGLCGPGVQLGDRGRAVRGLPGGGGSTGRSALRSAAGRRAAGEAGSDDGCSRRPTIEYLRGWAVDEASRGVSRIRTRRAWSRRWKSRLRGGPAIACWRWARICRSRPRCAASSATAKCAAATTGSWAAAIIAR